jgi:hypothetical protein
MCTVTYLPYRQGFILTHNRDEAPVRSPQFISRMNLPGDKLLFPRDTKAGGAWFVTSHSGKTACLLNGAFLKHRHEPPYRRSRGLILLDFYDWTDPNAFFLDYDFNGIEPFTMLFFHHGTGLEFRWDGVGRHLKSLPTDQPHFWCSATLYPPEMQEKREQVFRNWLSRMTPWELPERKKLAGEIWRLHQTGSVNDPENDYVMNRHDRVRTVSITQVIQNRDMSRMRYFDLLENHRNQRQIVL